MVSILQKKVLRDIRENSGSFIAIVCICALGIAIFSGINLYVSTVERGIESSYQKLNLADYWLYKQDVTGNDIEQILGVPDVETAQRRKMIDVGVSGNITGTLRLHGIEGEAAINIPELISGSLLEGSDTNALLMDSRFAEANGLKPGNTIMLSTGQEWIIKGIIRNAEYVYYAPDGLAVPDYQRYGFAYVNADALPEATYNEIILSLHDDTNSSHIDITAQIRQTLGSVNIMGRTHQSSTRYIEDDLEGIRQIGFLLPIVFFLTAALVAWITVGRMMDNQRQHLGTMRSLGFSKKEIVRRYTLFGIFITLPSMFIGWAISRFIAIFLYQLGTLHYTVEETAVAFFNVEYLLAVVCVATVTCGAAFLSCRKSLKSTAATMMRPKPPAQGHRILLERVTPFWKRLSFSGKIVTRNLFRNRVRMAMGLVGVIGSTALILCGFGMRDSINSMLDQTFNNAMRSDAEIKLKTAVLPEDATFIYEALEEAEHIDLSMAFSIFLYGDDGNMHNPYFVVLEDNQTSLNFIDVGGNQVSMPEDGVLITPRMSKALGAKIGDTIEAESLDGTVFILNVANIVDFPIGNEIYISRTAFSKISSLPFTVRAFLFQSENLDLESLRGDSRIASIQTKEDMKSSLNIVLELLQSIQVILIAFAGVLAFAVMMVLGRLNYHERIRELATLKVLGFHQNEMKRLVLRENIWIAVFGLPFGVVAGYGLLWTMMMQSANPDMEISATISIGSIVVACVLIFVFTLFVNYLLGRKFKGIDMVASLKSVE